MITVAQPTLLDLLTLCHNARPDEIEQYELLSGMDWQTESVAIGLHNRDGYRFVILNDDKPVVACGAMPLLEGTFDLWMVGTMDSWTHHWRSITKISRRIIEGIFKDGARRVQICVLASRQKTCEWYVRGLKLQYEGTMRQFGINGADMAMYARIAE